MLAYCSNKPALFEDLADELVIHRGEATELGQRKPDRVYGLQQTKHIERLIGRVTHTIQANDRDQLNHTPFGDRRNPIIYPLLISESKIERGESLEACERQTTFPRLQDWPGVLHLSRMRRRCLFSQELPDSLTERESESGNN